MLPGLVCVQSFLSFFKKIAGPVKTLFSTSGVGIQKGDAEVMQVGRRAFIT